MELYQTILLELLILSGSYLLQISPRIRNRYYGIDTWRWLLYADEIRKAGRLPDKVDKYIVEAPFNAPPLLLVLLAKVFPTREQAEKFNFMVNPFFNILENILLFTFVLGLTKNTSSALLSSLIFALTPADIIENTDLNMRSIGKLTFQLSFVALSLFLWKDRPVFGLFFALSVSLVLLSHRMSTQFLVMILILTIAMTLKISLLLYFLLGIAIAMLLSKGFYLRVARNHVSILKFWWENQRWRFANMLTGKIPEVSFKNLVWVFVKRLILRNPYLFIAVPFLWAGEFPLFPQPIENVLKGTILLALALAVLTTFVPFLVFLGEGYRYIGFLSFQVAAFIGGQIVPLFREGPHLILLVPTVASFVVSLLVMFLWLRRVFLQKDNGVTFSVTEQFQKIVNLLDQHGASYNFMSIPPVADDAIAYFSRVARVAFHDNGVALLRSMSYYPIIRNMAQIVDNYRLDYCLIHQNIFADTEVSQLTMLGKPLYQDNNLILYKMCS